MKDKRIVKKKIFISILLRISGDFLKFKVEKEL
jgi:hypothetical protein